MCFLLLPASLGLLCCYCDILWHFSPRQHLLQLVCEAWEQHLSPILVAVVSKASASPRQTNDIWTCRAGLNNACGKIIWKREVMILWWICKPGCWNHVIRFCHDTSQLKMRSPTTPALHLETRSYMYAEVECASRYSMIFLWKIGSCLNNYISIQGDAYLSFLRTCWIIHDSGMRSSSYEAPYVSHMSAKKC